MDGVAAPLTEAECRQRPHRRTYFARGCAPRTYPYELGAVFI